MFDENYRVIDFGKINLMPHMREIKRSPFLLCRPADIGLMGSKELIITRGKGKDS